MTKNWEWALSQSERERKVWKTFEKWVWTSQTHFLKNPIHDFQLIKNQFRFIEIDIGSLKKNFKTISIYRKATSINRNSEKKHSFEKQPNFVHKLLQALKNMNKMHEYELQSFSKMQVLNPVFPKLRFSNILHKFSSIKSVLHKNSKYLQTWLVKPKTYTITCTMFSKK